MEIKMNQLKNIVNKVLKGLHITFQEGLSVTLFFLKQKKSVPQIELSDYEKWIEQNENQFKEQKELKYNPLISVVIPVYNVKNEILTACIESVFAQTYTNWQLCMADDHSSWESVRDILKKYESNPKVKIVYRHENGHISRATNSAIELAEGEFIAFMDCDDTISPNALYEVALKLNENPKYDFIYTDEDKIDEKGEKRWDPHFKPDWSPDTLMSMMYTSHLGVYRTKLVKDLGGLRVGFEGSQDYDFTLRFTEKTQNIGHISKVLYHWRQAEGSTASKPEAKPYVFETAKKAKQEALARRGWKGTVEFMPDVYQLQVTYEDNNHPLVSIIIPSKDNFQIYKRCVESLVSKTIYKNYEIIHVDNGSDENNKKAYQILNNKYNIQYYYKKMNFNFSQMCNIGVNCSMGKYILFLNDDIEIIDADWLDKMLGQAELNHVGAVGAKLYYPNGDKIQHCGVVNLDAGPSHLFCGYSDSRIYYYGRNRLRYDVLAVTGACLLISKEKFREVNYFDENLPVAYNDVDLCFKLVEKGYFNVICNDVHLYHHESVSRGYDNKDKEKMKRLINERNKLYQKHSDFVRRDPFYSVNLTGYDVNCALNFREIKNYNICVEGDVKNYLPNQGNMIADFDCVRKTDMVFLQGYAYFRDKAFNNRRPVQLLLEGETETLLVNANKIYRPDLQQMLQTKKYINLTGFNCYLSLSDLHDLKYDLKIIVDGVITETKAFLELE